MLKRIFAFALALVCLVSFVLTMSACSEDTEESKGPSANLTFPEHLENLDFGGETVNFIVCISTVDDFNTRSIKVDEDDGDAVNSAIYARNAKIENKLNVQIEIADETSNSITSYAKTILLGGSSDFDIIAARQYDDVALALEGVILDLDTLDEYQADYIKWQEEYWASSYIEALTFAGKHFWVTGDLCMRYTSGYYAMFVNSTLYKGLLEPAYGSLYDIVRNHDWTYDTLIEMAGKCYDDTNGNDVVDIDGDRIGLALPVWDNINGMAISAGVIFTRYDENGNPSNNMTNTNATLLNFVSKCNQLITSPGVYSFGAPSYSYTEAMQLFSSGEAVFVCARLNQAELFLREMEDDYYVVPCPMLNKEQGAYYTGVHDAINIYGINYNSEKIPAAAATLDAMAYESYYNVRPIYYDSFLKFKYTRDNEAAEMIDIMHDNVYTDFVFIWQFASDLGDMGMFLRNNVVTNKASSNLKKVQDSWGDGLEKILSKINEIE